MTDRTSQASNVSLLGAKLNCTNKVAGSCKQAVRPESTPVGRTGADRGDEVHNSGRSDEWHLNHDKPFRHIAFELGAGFSQVREVPVVSFPSPGLVAIWAVGDAVGGDGVE